MGVLVYDITSRKSFENISNWLEECKIHGNPEMTIVLVGNKADLAAQREVTFVEGENYAQKNHMLFVEASAKTDLKIADIFTNSAQIVNEKINKNQIDPKNEMYGIKLGSFLQSSHSNLLKSLPRTDQKQSCCK